LIRQLQVQDLDTGRQLPVQGLLEMTAVEMGQLLLDQAADDHSQDTGDPAASSSVTARDDSCDEGQQQLPLQLLLTTIVEDKDRCGIIDE
jgi:hypothetical protein